MDVFEAMAKKDEREALAILSKDAAALHAHNANGSTVLMSAAFFGLGQVLDAAIAGGADVAAARADGYTALHFATEQGHLALVRRLIEAGAPLDAALKTNGVTPLAAACDREHYGLAEALLSAGASPDASGQRGPALVRAAAGGSARLVRAMLDGGADLERADKRGYTALLAAARAGHEEVVAALLARGADVAHRAEDGATALTCAMDAMCPPAIEALLAAGADPKMPSKREPLVKWALRHHAHGVLAALAKRGVKVPKTKPAKPHLELLSYEDTVALLKSKKGLFRKLAFWPESFRGRALVFRGDLRLRSLRLDHDHPIDGAASPTVGPGIVVVGDLRVDGTVQNGEQDFGPFLIVLGDLDVGNAAVGGADLHVTGDLRVRGAFHGYYNHGTTRVDGDVRAKLFIADDYSVTIGGKATGKVLAAGGHVKGKIPRAPDVTKVLASKFLEARDEDEQPALKSNAIFKALVAGKSIAR